MELTIERNYFKEHTHGQMLLNGNVIAQTLELPDRNNQRSISCIPEGVYNVSKGFNSKGQKVFQVHNVSGRDGIQIHIGNSTTEIRGCILVGAQYLNEGGRGKVLQSTIKFNELYNSLPANFDLRIKKN